MDNGNYIRLDNGDIYILQDIRDGIAYISSDYGFDKNRVKYSNKYLIGVLDEGDIVRIEYYSPSHDRRINRLFNVDWISSDRLHFDLSNGHMDFNLKLGEIYEEDYKPIITGIIPREKLLSSEQSFSDDSDMKLVL